MEITDLKSYVESFGGKIVVSNTAIQVKMPPTKKQTKHNLPGELILVPGTDEIAIKQVHAAVEHCAGIRQYDRNDGVLFPEVETFHCPR